MANVFSQLSIQLVFAVKNHNSLIHADFRDTLHKYIGGILVTKNHFHTVCHAEAMSSTISTISKKNIKNSLSGKNTCSF